MRALLLLAVLLTGCESTALDLTDPSLFNVTFEPPYLEGEDETSEVLLTFAGVDDPDDSTGEEGTRQVIETDLGGLGLDAWEFESNFKLRLVLRRYTSTPSGTYLLNVSITNAYGPFVASGEFFVFGEGPGQ